MYHSRDDLCPPTSDSVYLTPTSPEPYDPYEIVYLGLIGKYKHPRNMELMTKQNYTQAYYKNRYSTSC